MLGRSKDEHSRAGLCSSSEVCISFLICMCGKAAWLHVHRTHSLTVIVHRKYLRCGCCCQCHKWNCWATEAEGLAQLEILWSKRMAPLTHLRCMSRQIQKWQKNEGGQALSIVHPSRALWKRWLTQCASSMATKQMRSCR